MLRARENQIKALLNEVNELRDLFHASTRAGSGAHSFYKSPTLYSRKSFGNGTLLSGSIFDESEGDKLLNENVQTRIQRKLDNLKFTNASDSVSFYLS